jgi:hypothetical protein
VNDDQLEAAAYVLLFTTAPSTRMSAARCVEAYRLRWQIELQLKRWKSICHFDMLPNYRDDTMVSWVTAKLLLGLLLDRMGSARLAAPTTNTRAARALAREPWKMTTVMWPVLLAAILPLRLHELLEKAPQIAEQLALMSDHVDDRQVPEFRNRFYPASQRGAGGRQIC